MSARLVLPHDAPEADWLAARRQGVTASEIAALMGISPYESAFSLFWRKRGDLPPEPDNDAMSLGRHLEPWVADRFAETHPEFHVGATGLWQSEARPWQLCTPDRILSEIFPAEDAAGNSDMVTLPVAALEIKHSGSYDGWGDDGTDGIPVHYRAQVLWQLDTLDLGEAYVACLFLNNRQIRVYRVAYDVTDIYLMRKEAKAFLARLKADEAPPIDSHPATTAALKHLNPGPLDDTEPATVPPVLAGEYRVACRRAAEAQAEKDRLANELRAAMGASKRAVDIAGQPVATRSVYTQARADMDRLRREYPAAWAACRTESTVDKLLPARTAKDK